MYMRCANKRGKGGKLHLINQPKSNQDTKRKTTGQALHIKSQLNGDTQS